MSEHKARVSWERKAQPFTYEQYDRTHQVSYPGGVVHSASSAPEFLGKAEYPNPEELLAAALSSCHMLTFLAVAAKSRLIVDSYVDEAVAILHKNAGGKLAVTKTILNPKVSFAKETPVSPEKLKELHEKAHRNCFIANSVSCEVQVQI